MKTQFMLEFKDCISCADAAFIEISKATINLFKAKVCLPVFKNKIIEQVFYEACMIPLKQIVFLPVMEDCT